MNIFFVVHSIADCVGDNLGEVQNNSPRFCDGGLTCYSVKHICDGYNTCMDEADEQECFRYSMIYRVLFL